MKKLMILIIIFFINFVQFHGENIVNGILFEPNIFNNIEYDWNDYIWDENENACCNQISEINKISINLPSKIYINNGIVKKPPVPICISYYITEKRIYKYREKEHGLTLYIKHIDDKQAEWLSYPIEKIELIDYSMQEMMALPPNFEAEEKERNMLIEKYKFLSDNELNDGYIYGGNITCNISDYINFPLIQGEYDIYVSRNNIKSEHRIFEIIFNDQKKD